MQVTDKMVDDLAYRFWSIHPKELDPYRESMPDGYKGGVRAWFFAVEIRKLLAARSALVEGGEAEPPYTFDRYINGKLMAEGVTIERQVTLEGAAREAARIASRGSNGEAPVLVLTASPASTPAPADERVVEALEAVRPEIKSETEILKRLAAGDEIAFSEDGDCAFFTKGDRAFVGLVIVAMRSKGYLKRILLDDENYRGTAERDVISDAGRAALAGSGGGWPVPEGIPGPDLLAMSNGVISLHYEDLGKAQTAFDRIEALTAAQEGIRSLLKEPEGDA